MKLFDRLTKESVEVSAIQPNRYRVQQAARLNQHTDLQIEDIIHADGKKICQLSDQTISAQSPKIDVTQSLFEEAILTISRMVAQGQATTISPLLPTSLLGEDAALSSLEGVLKTVLKDGHLHHISQRPRLDLKYEELVTEVSRAKRTTNASLKHLVSHSECWQRRTLTGIIPRKVLARHSEDDYLLYENKVYASLLDVLERHLQWRLQRLLKLTKPLEDIRSFQNSESIDYRLIKTICALWGEVFDLESIEQQLDASMFLLDELEFLLRQIRGLKQQGVYTLIPQETRVSGQVYRTNVFNHDAHYRHLPLLWDHLAKEAEKKLSPEETFCRNRELHQAYTRYVGLVIRRALEAKKLDGSWDNFNWGGTKIEVREAQDDWVVESSCGNKLRLVSWLHYGSAPPYLHIPNTIVCWPDIPDERLEKSVLPESNLPITPFDLYVVERMGEVIDKWLVHLLLKGYGEVIPRVPDKAKNVLNKYSVFQADGSHGIKCTGACAEPIEQIMNSVSEAGINKQTFNKIEMQLKNNLELSKCPVCYEKSSLKVEQNSRSFFAECEYCNTTWLLQNGLYRQFISGRKETDFSKTGRMGFEVAISY